MQRIGSAILCSSAVGAKQAGNQMQRFRWTNFDLDGTRTILQSEQLPEEFKERERQTLKARVGAEYGVEGIDAKFARWAALKVPNLCAPVEYRELLHEAEGAYVRGDFYPALTGACCLGERILNHLLLRIRKHRTSHPRSKEVRTRESMDNWERAMTILAEWGALNDSQRSNLRDLRELRNQAVHFGSVDDRERGAKHALDLVHSLTDSWFGQAHDRFFWVPGEIYVKKDYETDPVTIEFVLPHCVKVGYRHVLDFVMVDGVRRLAAFDDDNYADGDVTDVDYRVLREDFNKAPTKPNSAMGRIASNWEF